MSQSVAAGLAGEAVVAPVESIVVDAAQVLRAAVAELRRSHSTAVARSHCLVESPETASLNLFTCLRLQILVSAVLRVVTFECGWVMRRIWMSGRCRVRACMLRTRMMLGIGMRVTLGLRLGLHVDSIGKISRRVIVYF
jgi:hypothetical protein